MSTSTLPDLLVAADVARLLGCSERQLRHMRARGQGPRSVKLEGLGVRWPRAEVEAYLEAASKAAR